jgi:hypothetical protein
VARRQATPLQLQPHFLLLIGGKFFPGAPINSPFGAATALQPLQTLMIFDVLTRYIRNAWQQPRYNPINTGTL